MSNFDFDDFIENPHEGKTWNAKNDFNDIRNQAKEADNPWKHSINQASTKEVGSNWKNNLDMNMKILANTAETACNIFSGEEKKQCETVAEKNGMNTQVID